MQHPNILSRDNVHASPRNNVPNLDKTRLKGQNVRIGQRKSLRLALPDNLPVRPRAPAVAVHKEGELGVVEEELTVEPLDVDGLGVLFQGDEVEGGVGLVEQGLRF